MTTAKHPKTTAQTQRQHRGLAIVFGLCTLLFAVIIVYFAFAKTTITITPNSQPVTVVFPLTITAVAPTEDDSSTLVGQFATTTAAAEADLPQLTNAESVDAKATGTVTITNTWSQDQPLAATTRLLSEEGVLYRLDSFVSVPARGTAEVAVTADQAGASGNSGPTHFTIPGLSSELQQKIYGDSAAAMTGGTVSRAIVTEGDLTELRQQLAEKLTAQAHQTLTQQLTEGDATVTADSIRFFASDAEEQFSASAGDAAESLSGSTTATVVGIAFSSTDLYTSILDKLLAQLPPGETLESFGEENFSLALESYDAEAKQAVINVTAHAVSTVDVDDGLLQPSRFTNKSKGEILSALSGLSIIDTVEVDFSPIWVTRSPALADHITITIVKPETTP